MSYRTKYKLYVSNNGKQKEENYFREYIEGLLNKNIYNALYKECDVIDWDNWKEDLIQISTLFSDFIIRLYIEEWGESGFLMDFEIHRFTNGLSN